MKKIALVILSVLIGFSSPAKMRREKKKKKQPANDIISVQAYRTGCFGRCPTYIVKIHKDGIATYTAVRFNDDSGIFQKNIGVTKAAQVLNEVNSYRVDTCKEMYDNMIPDLPNLNFEIVYKNKVKKIYSAKDGPMFLQKLAKTIEDAGLKNDNVGWKRVEGTIE